MIKSGASPEFRFGMPYNDYDIQTCSGIAGLEETQGHTLGFVAYTFSLYTDRCCSDQRAAMTISVCKTLEVIVMSPAVNR